MSALAIPAATFTTYFANVIDGQGQREIARLEGVEPSTIHRRIVKCEGLRDCPEWDAIFDALAPAYRAAPGSPITPNAVACALGLSCTDILDRFADCKPDLERRGSDLVCGAFEKAAIVVDGALVYTMAHKMALAFIAFGFVTMHGKPNGAVRRYRLTAKGRPVATSPDGQPTFASAPVPNQMALTAYMRRGQSLVTPAHLASAQSYAELHSLRGGVTGDEYALITSKMPPRLVRVLDAVCGENEGFEAVEARENLPARSCKVLVVAALEVFSQVSDAA